jgi:hypothetical protein
VAAHRLTEYLKEIDQKNARLKWLDGECSQDKLLLSLGSELGDCIPSLGEEELCPVEDRGA